MVRLQPEQFAYGSRFQHPDRILPNLPGLDDLPGGPPPSLANQKAIVTALAVVLTG